MAYPFASLILDINTKNIFGVNMTSSIALFLLQAPVEDGFFNLIVEKFNEGNDGGWMWPVLITLILGLVATLALTSEKPTR